DQLHVKPPAMGGQSVNTTQLAQDLAERLIKIFTQKQNGYRAFCGSCPKFGADPHWKDLPLFHEYFHGDNGAGLGASHQTGWTALVANVIDEWRK
ncbi:MAG: glucosidase, partial [Planctomycetota bacterium]